MFINVPSFFGGIARPEIRFRVRCSQSFWHRRAGCFRLEVQCARSVHSFCTYPRKSVPRNRSKERVGGLRAASNHATQVWPSLPQGKKQILWSGSRRNLTCRARPCRLDRHTALPPRERRKQALQEPPVQTCPFPRETRMHPSRQTRGKGPGQ